MRGALRRLRSQVVCGDRGSRNPYHNHQRPRPRGRRRHRRIIDIIGNGAALGGCAGLVFSALEGLEGSSNYFGYGSRAVASTNTSSNACAGSSREDTRCKKPGLKKAKPLDGLLRDHPSQLKAVDPGIEHEFNKVFMTTSKEGKQALIKGWMDRKKCDREEAMRLAIEEWRRDNR